MLAHRVARLAGLLHLGMGAVANYVDRFQESLGRIASEQTAFFDLFYQLFIAANEEVAEKFKHTDFERQKRVLRESLKELLMFFLSHRITPYMKGLARVHDRSHRDIRPELYELWLEKLLEAARRLDEHFDDDDELAWRLVLRPGIEFMKFHYDRGGDR